jgi:hypothetical protein
MRKVFLTEAEVKVALRKFIEKSPEVYGIEWAWGEMSLLADGQRINEIVLSFPQEKTEEELRKA